MDDVFSANRNDSIDQASASPQPDNSDPNHLSSINPIADGPPAPVQDAHGRVLNPRSCVTCRRRKVKCDKTHPCRNCTRQHIECVFPTPGRAPRKARKISDTRDVELLARLRRLEGVVKRMGVDPVTEEPTLAQDGATNSHANEEDSQPPKPHLNTSSCPSEMATSSGAADQAHDDAARPQAQARVGHLENRFGRLVVNEGKSRYINSSFWANLSTEVEDLKGILNEDTDEEDEASPTAFSAQAGHSHGWVFSFSSQNVDLLSLHPIPIQLETYWEIYKENVDPLVKVLHIPSLEPTVLAAASHLANLSKSFEVLLFSIYYGAATSLSPEDCLVKLGEERSVLLSRYKFAVEQALARANFLTTEEIVVLQSFVIFLICLRRNNEARVIWTLTGLVVRIAQTIGIHRDGQHFGLAPFEVEMRRRLWWQVCILDVRASEDHGCDPTIIEQSFDTKMPLNVDDIDLDPRMKALPTERVGCTDMTFSLIRFEVANTFRRINYIPPGPPRSCGDFFASATLEDKERWITECHQRLEEKYLQHCDMTVPIYWVTATVARLMMSKMWLMVYHPFQRQDGSKNLSSEIREKLFITSLENIEYSLLLQTEARTMKWGWLFKTYMQWHAFAFILAELCHRTRGELVDRAWLAVEKSRDGRWAELTGGHRNGHLWRPLDRVIAKARVARNKALMEDQAARVNSAHQAAVESVGMGSTPPPAAGSTAPRPRFVRAPLSAAQLQRFMSPPTYGTQPIDSTNLMRSPKLEDTILLDDNMDISTLLPELVEQSPPDEESTKYLLTHEILDQQRLEAQSRFAQLNVANAAFGTTGPSPLGFGPFGAADLGGGTNNPFLSNGSGRSTSMGQSQAQSTAGSPPAAFNFGGGPIGNVKNMTSAMNKSGAPVNGRNQSSLSPLEGTPDDIDWSNWDDLVRQFGMDVDQTGGAGVGGVGNGDWNGPSWGNGMGMGGMGGGVIF